MSSKAGTLTTFLLSVPVSAILLMAIFGIPRLAPGTSSGPNENAWRDPRQFFAGMDGESSSQDLFSRYGAQQGPVDQHDPFAETRASNGDAPQWNDRPQPAERPEWESRSEQTPPQSPARPGGWPLQGQTEEVRPTPPLAQWEAVPPAWPPSRVRQNTTPVETASHITWIDARRRLTELGIDEFHLEPGADESSFLFVCVLTPGDSPGVTRRFEAQAEDPLMAVEQALGQVENWLETRFGRQTQQVVAPFRGLGSY